MKINNCGVSSIPPPAMPVPLPLAREAKQAPLDKGERATKWRGDNCHEEIKRLQDRTQTGEEARKNQQMNFPDKKHNPALTPRARELRKNMTREESHLWYDFLREYPVRFLRQKIIDCYIVDFYCRSANLVIELDGSQHYEEKTMEYDENRTSNLEKRGLKVIRIPNNEVRNNFDGVCLYIDKIVSERISEKDNE